MANFNKQQGPGDAAEFKRVVGGNTYGEPTGKVFSTLINHPEVGLQYEATDRWANKNDVHDIAPIATSSWASKYAGMEKNGIHASRQRKRDEEGF